MVIFAILYALSVIIKLLGDFKVEIQLLKCNLANEETKKG